MDVVAALREKSLTDPESVSDDSNVHPLTVCQSRHLNEISKVRMFLKAKLKFSKTVTIGQKFIRMAIVTVQIELIGESDLHLERMILLLAILQFVISTSSPAPVALEGRLCLSGKPHEYLRSLVRPVLPPLAKLGIPRAGVATAVNLHSPTVTGPPLRRPAPTKPLKKKKKAVERELRRCQLVTWPSRIFCLSDPF